MIPTPPDSHMYDEFLAPPFASSIDSEIPFGTRSKDVQLVQECLSLRGFVTSPDGIFGTATRATLSAAGYPGGALTPEVYSALVLPFFHAAVPPYEPGDVSMAKLALYHYSFRPHEVGGQNRGPWVRLYCHGHDGAEYPWCAAFVSYVMFQTACYSGHTSTKLPYTLSCDTLYDEACKANMIVTEPEPGDIFLLYKGDDHFHAGIVVDVLPNAIKTVEGNTNDDGSREGYKVCTRFRAVRNMDFVRPF